MNIVMDQNTYLTNFLNDICPDFENNIEGLTSVGECFELNDLL